MVANVAALAADDQTPTTPTNNLTLDNGISISGLEEDDTVRFYQVLKFDSTAKTTGGWVAAEGFTGLSDANIRKILGIDDNGFNVVTESNKDSYGIDAALAASIADMAESATAKYANIAATKGTGESTYTAAKSGAEAGLYVALVTPGQVGTIYNPVFVGADYKDNTSNTWTVVTLTESYSPASLAKRYKVTLDKVATAQTNNNDSTAEYDNLATVDIGDTVSFKVDTTIPKFGANYTDPVFKVTDVLSTGLTLDEDSVVVKAGETTLTAGADEDYTITTSATGYVVTFAKTYLDSVGATGQAITITYDAEVTTAVAKSINHEDNTVTLNFSNNPTDTTGNGMLKDKTNHYSFTIDGLLWGSDI